MKKLRRLKIKQLYNAEVNNKATEETIENFKSFMKFQKSKTHYQH